MTYVITQNCCKDASCVAACPVNCIHPAPGEAGYGSEPMLYVDPQVCIDCGACADACPVDAAVPEDVLGETERVYAELSEQYFARAGAATAAGGTEDAGPLFRSWERPGFDWSLPSDFAGLDVAVVGTGPAGLYAAELLLLHTPSRVTLIDRLPVAGGLVRYGVAPDHPGTKRVGGVLGRLYDHPRVRLVLGVEIGRDLAVDELAQHVDAVVYAVGAAAGRRLGIAGEELPGTHTAPELVGWYNAHPDIPADAIRLRGERAVVVGTGNVALDVARILTTDPDALAGTDIADHALAALRTSGIGEVVVLGRRGPEHAAYSLPELLALSRRPGVELVVDDGDPRTAAAIEGAGPHEHASLLRGLRRVRLGDSAPPEPGRRIVLRFHSTLESVAGTDAVTGVRLTDGLALPAGLVVTSIGYGGQPVEGLPFDPATASAPNSAGRIDGVPGAYAVGWFKRGATGGIGDNRLDAAETVQTLIGDAVAGCLPAPRQSARSLLRTVRRRNPQVVDAKGLTRILDAEQARGRADGRVAAKFATREDLLRAGRGK